MLNLRVGDRVSDVEGFRGKALGPSGAVYDTCPKNGETEIRLWAVENLVTREVRHLREDRLSVSGYNQAR
ncbi:MAG: hypothetical protein JWP32_2350 [Schumannella sp.]|nr:hypothetical protein [Schumannella sp.]